jgi:hypothetical protein
VSDCEKCPLIGLEQPDPAETRAGRPAYCNYFSWEAADSMLHLVKSTGCLHPGHL